MKLKRFSTLITLLLALCVFFALSGLFSILPAPVSSVQAATYSRSETASITAQNTFSDPIKLKGQYNLSISGNWSATVYLQRSFDDGTTWLDVDSFTANTELVGTEPEQGVKYRFGVKTGGYTSGAVVGRLSQ